MLFNHCFNRHNTPKHNNNKEIKTNFINKRYKENDVLFKTQITQKSIDILK